MREIKVRGYAVDEMVNNQWLYGTGIHRTVFAEHFAKEVGQSGETFIWTESGWVQIVEGSQSQYTGLKDKNGREIFEGDILSYYGFTYEVVCKDCAFGWVEDGEFNPFAIMAISEISKTVIIGNIHEHPHLLQEDSKL